MKLKMPNSLPQNFDFSSIEKFLSNELKKNKTIYPPVDEIFTAFELTPLEQVKVVIIGQDPYHGPNQAHGLAFSVREGVKLPPSLKNIFKELESDLSISASSGDLSQWARSGVLLLNDVLTVEESKPGLIKKLAGRSSQMKLLNCLIEKRKSCFYSLGKSCSKEGT